MRFPLGRVWHVLVVAILAAGCCGATQQPEETTPGVEGQVGHERADAARLACADVDALDLGTSTDLDLSEEALEGGAGEVFRSEGRIHRITGGLLGESFRFSFDYRYRDATLLCATETVTTLHTIVGSEPEGPPPMWRLDFAVFDGGEAVSHISDQAPNDASPHHDPAGMVDYAARLLSLASQAPPEPQEGTATTAETE